MRFFVLTGQIAYKCLHLPKFLLLSLVFTHIYISQGSVKTHLPCGEIYNNRIIASYLQSVAVIKNLTIGQ